MIDSVKVNLQSACGHTFATDTIMRPDGTMNLLVDIEAPISIPRGESRRIPTPIHVMGNGNTVVLMEVHAGLSAEALQDPQPTGQFVIPPTDSHVQIEVLVVNDTGASLMIQPNYVLGVLSFMAQERSESNDAGFTNEHEPDEPFEMVAVFKPQHFDESLRPEYATPGAAGMDLRADVEKTVVLKPGERQLIQTGLSTEIPAGFEGQIRPRSGLAFKHGITVTNSPATIDSDYRGQIGVILHNLGQTDFEINPGDRIAQFVIAPVMTATMDFRDALGQSERGSGGFGSTGRQ
jgi:dUTP pyrophosphatase